MSPPQEIKGAWIWSEVVPALVPEIDFKMLLELGTIVKQRKRIEIYNSLRASLRKIQWTKLSGTRAVAIERDVSNQKEPNTLILDPFGITDHSLCITDCLIHTKSALDSIAVFLNDLLDLHCKSDADRDLKHTGFRNRVISKDHSIGNLVKELGPWIDEVQKLRDEWIHRSTVEDVVIIGPSNVGTLPLPKRANLNPQQSVTSENLWSTSDFVKFHYNQFVRLFNTVIKRAKEIEAKELEKIPVSDQRELGMALFRTKLTENMNVKTIRVSNIFISSYYKRLSELFREFETLEKKVNGSHFEFLTNLCDGLWDYIRDYFGLSVDRPNIRVMFVTENEFRHLGSSESNNEIRKGKMSTIIKGFLDTEKKQECYFIVLQVSRLEIAGEYFKRHLEQSLNTSEVILRLLIYELIHIYEEKTEMTYLKTQKPIDDEEIQIYNKFKEEHPEFFTRQSDENMQKTLRKIPV